MIRRRLCRPSISRSWPIGSAPTPREYRMTRPLPHDSKDDAIAVIVGGVVVAGALWLAGAASALMSGHKVPHGVPLAGVVAFGHIKDPSAAWHGAVGPAVLYWFLTAV